MRGAFVRSLNSHRWLVVILVAFVALGVTYSIVTPIFEAGDELWHYPFVQFLATGHGLPIQDPNVETLWEQEGGQPPLYYALSALATFWIDTRDLPDRLWRNPHAKIGIPLAFGNKNMVVHTSAEDSPWRNTTLAVHLIRFLSLILSALTVALTYLLALEIGKWHVIASPAGAKQSPQYFGDCFGAKTAPRNDTGNKALAALAAALVAFNPMFIFISASVNNDNLATMLATLALLLLARLITRGATLRRFVVLGVVLGLGALTKVSDLGLLGVAACVFAYLLWQSRRGEGESGRVGDGHRVTLSPGLLGGALLCATLVILIAFWWYARNWALYGDPLAFNVWLQIAGGRPTPATLSGLFDEFQGFRISFWGNFGGVNLIAPDWVYIVLDAFTVLALVGLLVGGLRRALPRLLWLPALWLAIISLSLIRWTWLTLASQGRLVFPAISAVAILLAYGLAQFQISDFRFQITHHVLRFTHLSFVIFLLAFAILAPLTLIAPAYALPARLSDAAAVPHPAHITFDNQAELVGYALPQKSVVPGGELPLTVYWRARERIAEDFSVYIRLFDGDGKIVARWEAFPGGGLYPTRVWQPGEVIQDRYRLPLALDARAPSAGRIEVGLFRRVPLETLTARDPQGRTVTPTIARFKIAQATPTRVQAEVHYEFGNRIALIYYTVYAVEGKPRAGGTLRVPMYWRALAPMDEDYTVFLHLLDRDGKIIAQTDAQPHQGAYPTSFWDVGEIVRDAYELTIPPDAEACAYLLYGGLYRARDGARLRLPSGADRAFLAEVCVSKD